MTQNTVFYGPPGTGKTYSLQGLIDDYIDYSISNQQIVDAYTQYSKGWLLVALLILQQKGKMRPPEIQAHMNSLNLQQTVNVSAVLEKHKIAPSELGVRRELPRIFFEYSSGQWYVDRSRLLKAVPDFFETYFSTSNVERRYSFVTFHQSFSYEDFVEGIRPTYNEKAQSIDYTPKPGVFKLLCDQAELHPEKNYAMFIDEINRGNISEIFGELITLIELDKRKGQANELSCVLPYSKSTFVVPANVSIYGTMNSADKSIAAIDIALRRRFKFVPVLPDSNIIKRELELSGLDASNVEGVNLIKMFNIINARIELLLDSSHLIGHSFFLGVSSADDIVEVVKGRIIPLLEEYFFDDVQEIQLVFNDLDEEGQLRDSAIYCHRELLVDKLLPFVGEYLLDDRKQYFVNPQMTPQCLIHIYDGIDL